MGRCAFQLDGIVTMVDTNRDLIVLQDETGAVALNPQNGVGQLGIQAGQRVSLEGSRCQPYVVGFPKYPYQPSGWDLRPSFEAPTDWGEFHLTRMRGYLNPPVTGEYTFWIASDNSSDLWLSSNRDPAKAKRIAYVGRYGWVAPHEWSHYPSQRSESVLLQAGRSYYIEALQEQTTVGDHLAVAWQGPNLEQSVIETPYLMPWNEKQDLFSPVVTNGILREYWTNFSLGGLTTLSGPKNFESTLAVEDLQVRTRHEGRWPEPLPMTLSRQLSAEENFLWREIQGKVTFTSGDGAVGVLELSDGQTQMQVRVAGSDAEWLRRLRNSTVRVEGVCEGGFDQKGALIPAAVWTVKDMVTPHAVSTPADPVLPGSGQPPFRTSSTNSIPSMMGFYATRGVVTFNDRVFGKDYMFVQEETAAVFVSLKDRNFVNRFEVGRWVELSGSFQPGRNIPTIRPLTVTELGLRSMPEPLMQPTQFPVPPNRDGRWTEAEGVVRSVNSNGSISLMGRDGPLSVWIGRTSNDTLQRYVDAKLRLRGVLSLTIQDAPLLLVPSPEFVDVERESPADRFAIPTGAISNLVAVSAHAPMPHRVKLAGNVTFIGERTFFMQDMTGGIRVHCVEDCKMQVGQSVEVVGFPDINGSIQTLTEALVRPAKDVPKPPPRELDAGEGISFKHAGTLVRITARLIAQRIEDGSQILELQEKQRMFEAELPLDQTELPVYKPGSRLQLVGVCDFATTSATAAGNTSSESPSVGAMKIWLRSPADVVWLSGPPWWTWKHTAALVGTLLSVLLLSLLRIHLLRRRLERHLAFSQQILESQESERHRIAANLHDSLGQNLLVIINQARMAMQPSADESTLRDRLGKISDCASEAIEEVREITHALRPYQLDRLGLTQTIRASVNRAAENNSIRFASHADEIDGLLDKESEIHVYRIIQEAVNNILKHSKATEATVVVKRLPAAVSLSVRDNGLGLDEDRLAENSRHAGHGISGIKERVRILGGTFMVDSRPGLGTTLNVEIPVSSPKNEAA